MSSFLVYTRKERMHRIPLFVKIEPLARPRAFTPPNSKFARIYQPLENQKDLLAHMSRLNPLQLEQPLIIDLYVNFKKAKTSKMNFPTGRNHGDEDNLRKAVMDALVKGKHILDDSLVVGGQTMKTFAEEDFAVIDIYSVNAEPKRYDLEL